MRKGFTLIELLAVIVILAIIALIATPIILGVVENARKSAAGSSALGYLDAVEKDIALGSFNELVYPTGKIDIKSVNPYDKIEVQGEAPSEGTLYVLDDYQIAASVLCVNDYRVVSINHKIDSIKKDCDDMDILIDYSENKNYGYLRNDPTWTHEGLKLDGIDDYIYAGLIKYGFKKEVGIVLRAQFNKTGNDIFENRSSSGIALTGHSNSRVNIMRFQAYPNTGDVVKVESSEDHAYELNTWYTIVGTVINGKMHLYMNGIETALPADFNDNIKDSPNAFIIGADPQDPCVDSNHTCNYLGPTAMEFTDAIIFDRGLSEEEVKRDFSGKITHISNQSKMILRYDIDIVDNIPEIKGAA